MKTIVITGASDGLGKALAAACIEEKFKVVNLSRTPCDIEGVINIKCDLSKEEDIEIAVNEIKEKHANFNVLVNSAAIVALEKVNQITYKKFENAYRINAIAPLFLISRLYNLIVENQADIINIGTTHSQASVSGAESQLAYVSTKYGLRGGSYNLAMELKKTKSRLIHVHLGGMNTEMHKKDYGIEMLDPENWMKPGDIANILLYLVNLPKQIEISEITINRKGRRMN